MHEARIGEPAVAIVIGDLLRLHQEMSVSGAEERPRLERLDEIQHLEHREALRRGGRLVDRHAAIAAADRLAPVRALGGEILLAEEAAQLGELHRDFAFVEPRAALLADRLQRARERRVGKLRLPDGEKRRRCRILRQLAGGLRDPPRKARAHRIAVAGVADRLLKAARERQLSEARMRFAEAGDRAWRRQRGGDDAAEGNFSLVKTIKRGRRRGAAAAIEIRDLARSGVVDQPEGVAADAAHVRIDDAKRRGGGDRRIDGGAAAAQHAHAGLGGERVRAGHHAVPRFYLSFFLARRVPATSASSFFSATSRSIGAMPQLVHGYRCLSRTYFAALAIVAATSCGVSTWSLATSMTPMSTSFPFKRPRSSSGTFE